MNQVNKMYLVIGDWSDDGHGKSDKILLEINHTVEEVQQAYKDSCKLTGISFNINEDYTERGRDWQEISKYQICCDYEDNLIKEETMEILEKYKCPLLNNIKKDDKHIYDKDLFINLLMWFISLSLNDLKYEHIQDNVPVINGYWNNNLNVGFGYGIYE